MMGVCVSLISLRRCESGHLLSFIMSPFIVSWSFSTVEQENLKEYKIVKWEEGDARSARAEKR